ncbi:Peptidase M15A, C-terminal [uncultured Caudovirales phage]|uniref:Peptidase M15A, C-terminal n=1 Tax=uncultured Caudovirales phage TaxID=2100421 RepID=A0A6J5N3U2_9CAUD|nr:Peptidase M15A, C-terminal [uncultured Caudovirales phage]
MQQISKHISWSEAVSSPTAIKEGIVNIPNASQIANMKLLAENIFEPLREWAKEPIKVNSMFRSEALNKQIGGAKNSQHCANEGSAIDIDASGSKTNSDLFHFIKDNLKFDQLIWEFGNTNQPNWIHVSFRSGNNRGQILKAIKLGSKTKYIPF